MKIRRIALGVVSLLPAVYCIVFIAVAYSALVLDRTPGPMAARVLIGIHLTCIVLLLGLVCFYVWHAWRNQALSAEERRCWIIALCLLNAFSIPVYWYKYIFRRGATPPAKDMTGGSR